MADTKQWRILNVDDNEAGRYATTKILKNAGFDVIEAVNGASALEKTRNEHPDLVLLDVNLPDISGFEVCKQIKLNQDTATILVVHLSATYVTPQDRVEGLTGGADGYLVSPVDPGDLVETIRAFLRIREMERTLRESEEKFRELFTRMPSAVAIYDAVDGGKDFIFKDFNTAAEKIEGINKDDLVGKRVTQVFPGVRDLGLFAVFCRVWRTGQPEFFPQALYRDECMPAAWRENWVYRLSTGEIVAIYNDVTERKQAEEALRKAALLWQNTFNSSQDAICLFGTDHRIVICNRSMAEILGVKNADDLIGRNCWEVVHGTTGPIPGCPFERMRESRKRETLELQIGDRWFFITADPVFDEKQTLVGVVHNIRDITESRLAQEALRESSEKIQLLLNSTAEAIYGLDMQGLCTLCNTAFLRMMGYERAEQVLGRDIHGLIHHTHADGTLHKLDDCRIYKAFLQGEGTHADDEVFWRSDGTSFPVEYWSYPIRRNGSIIGAVVTFFDITERKAADEALRDMLADKEVLMLELHHRVKNNFAVLISLLGMHADSIHDEQTLALIKEMEGRIAIMVEVHQSLYQSKNVSQINFSEFIKTLSERQMQSLGGEHRIDLKVDGGDVMVSLDVAIPAGLIVNELVTNAIKHAFPGGYPPPVRAGEPCRITISFTQTDEEYTLVVSDNGTGIPPDFDWKTTRSLGLRLVNILVRHQLQGTVDLHTGQGTEFVLKFKDRRKKRSESS